MNKRVGILTLFGYQNYGNRLQNYAVHEILREKGYESETIVYVNTTPKKVLRNIKSYLLLDGAEKKRRHNFKKFVKRTTPIRRIYGKDGFVPDKLASEYAYFVTGSDQVWNPEVRFRDFYNFFLRFAERNQRICFSPSIATDVIPKETKHSFVEGLEGFRYLACREKTGAEIIKAYTGRKAETLIDPTLYISKERWHKLYQKEFSPQKPYILKFFLGDDGARTRLIKSFAEKGGYDIIDLTSTQSKEYSADPSEFLQLIENASLVLTDSFHALAFSINFEVPFYAFSRVVNEAKSKSMLRSTRMYSRILNLLETFNLSDRDEEGFYDGIDLNIDFAPSREILEKERERLSKFLDKSLSQQDEKHNIAYLDERECVGCSACSSVCPKDCIEIKRNADGFYVPVVDEDKCINCKICANTCPVLNHAEKKDAVISIAGHNRDENIVKQSSSGGLFYSIATKVIEKGGIVFGAAYDKDGKVVHKAAETSEELKPLMTSKYVQSFIGDTYLRVKEELATGREVFFVGAPCQTEGLLKVLGGKSENLLIADFICHGVPSPKVWEDYLKFADVEGIKKISMRDKTYGWKTHSMRIEHSGGLILENKHKSPYLNAFLKNIILNTACFNCEFKGTKRVSDITMGDFWGVEGHSPENAHRTGTSIVLIRSDKGVQMLDSIRDFRYNEIPLTMAEKSNTALMSSVKNLSDRDRFFAKYDRKKGLRFLRESAYRAKVKKKRPIYRKALYKLKRIIFG